MTRGQVTLELRQYRRLVFRYNGQYIPFPKKNAVFRECIYGKVLVDELIQRIRHSDEDPIVVVSHMYTWLDDILSSSDDGHFETHAFTALMEYLVGDILRYLRTIEKERNEDAKN